MNGQHVRQAISNQNSPILLREQVALQRIRWVPALIIALYYFSLWYPPIFPIIEWKWFTLLGLAVWAFFLNSIPLSSQPSRLYLIVNLLYLLGAGLALLRGDTTSILYNNLGVLASIVTYLLMLPIVNHKQTRILLIAALLIAATMWAAEIISRTMTLGDMARLTFAGHGQDKNYLCLLLDLAASAAWVIFLFGDFKKIRVIRMVLVAYILFLGTAVLLLYSRSGLITFFIGNVGILLVYSIHKRSKGFIIFVAVIALTGYMINNYADTLFTVLPYWKVTLSRLVDVGAMEQTDPARIAMIQKAWSLINSDPFIGIGVGAFKTTFVNVGDMSTGLLSHNQYLSTWTETGLPGILGLVILAGAALSLLGRRFQSMVLVDKCWLLAVIPYFIMILFLDVGTNLMFMTVILSVIYFQYSQTPSGIQKRFAPGLRSVDYQSQKKQLETSHGTNGT